MKRTLLNILYSVITIIVVVSGMNMIWIARTGEVNVGVLAVISTPILIIAIWMVRESNYRVISRITATIIGIVTFFIVENGLAFSLLLLGEYLVFIGDEQFLYAVVVVSPILAIITGVYVALKWLKRPSKKKATTSTE